LTTQITLYGKQNEIFHDWLTDTRHVMTVVPVGSGKSFMAAWFLAIAAATPAHHQGRDVIYSAPTLNMAKTIVWPKLKEIIQTHWRLSDRAFNNSELTVTWPAGNFIRIKSAEQRQNLRGINSSIWVLDEAALYTAEVLQEISNRLRPAVGDASSAGRMIVITTPHGRGAFYDMYQSASKNTSQWRIHHYDYRAMGSGDPVFIESQRDMLSSLKFNQDFMCSFESINNQFFYEFSSSKHTARVNDTGGDLYTFHDFNKRVATAIVAQVTEPYTNTGTIHVLRSYAIDNCGTEQMAQLIRADYPQRRIYSVIDQTGSHVNRDTTSPFGVTDRTLLEKYAFTIINNSRTNPLIVDTDNSSNHFIRGGRLTVDPAATRLIEALNSYHYTDAERRHLVKYNDKYAYIDGLGDCMRYGIHHLFQLTHNLRPGETLGASYAPAGELFPGGPTLEEIWNDTGADQYRSS